MKDLDLSPQATDSGTVIVRGEYFQVLDSSIFYYSYVTMI